MELHASHSWAIESESFTSKTMSFAYQLYVIAALKKYENTFWSGPDVNWKFLT